MEAEPLDATGACFPAVRLWMVPRYHLGENTEALRRASQAFRAAHPELDLPLACPKGTMSGLPEGQLIIPNELRPRPLPLCVATSTAPGAPLSLSALILLTVIAPRRLSQFVSSANPPSHCQPLPPWILANRLQITAISSSPRLRH